MVGIRSVYASFAAARRTSPARTAPRWRASVVLRSSRAEDAATGLVGGQSGLCPFADPPGFVLSYGRENVDRHAARMGIVDGDELDAGFHQAGREVQVAGKPVELGDDERCALPLRPCDRLRKFRAAGILAALNLRERLQDLRAVLLCEGWHGLLLSFQAKPGLPLTIG